jgi:hypothetical protein
MSDRLRLLARQAWARVEQLGHDPVDSIHKALIYAQAETAALPAWADVAYQSQREVALVLAGGPLRLGLIAKQLGITRFAAGLRLARLRRAGVVVRLRYGVWGLEPAPPPMVMHNNQLVRS